MVRVDYIFSYWILFWYILFILKIINYNPKFILIIAIIQNSLGLLYKLLYEPILNSFILAIIILFTKIIPLYSIVNTKIKNKDIYFAILLFIFYNFWIYINETNLYEIIGEINYNQGPLFLFVKSWFPR
jgi:hypothetical protein|tara:strand:- start:24 stop:410 length:387 start_codon:yes stop_codon:yes gene_type:complete